MSKKLYSALISLGRETNDSIIVTHDVEGNASWAWTKISGANATGIYYVSGKYADGDMFVRAVISIDDDAWPRLGFPIDYGVIANNNGNAIWGVGGDSSTAVISNGILRRIDEELDCGTSLLEWSVRANKPALIADLCDEADLTDLTEVN
jgi:hypothetical protein